MFAWFRSTANRRPRCAQLGASDAQLAAHSNLRKPASLLDGQAGRSRVGATSRFESARSARNESAHLRIQKATLRRECWGSGRERRRPDSQAFPRDGRPPRAPRVSLRGVRKQKRSAFRTRAVSPVPQPPRRSRIHGALRGVPARLASGRRERRRDSLAGKGIFPTLRDRLNSLRFFLRFYNLRDQHSRNQRSMFSNTPSLGPNKTVWMF